MVQKFLIVIAVSLVLVACQREDKTNGKAGNKPNIVLIITDDQGYGDLGFTGNPMIHTPNIDEFAAQSTHFSSFYVDPVCAPTRSALMTGKFYLRTGIYDTFNGGAIMAPEETTIAEILKANGYRTGIFGKWHLGDHYPTRPGDQGFISSLVHKSGGIGQVGDLDNFHRTDSSYFDPVLYRDNQPVRTKGYCTDVFTDGALEFIKENRDEPFFLYVAYNAPHTPLQVPEKYLERYADLDLGLGEREEEAAKRVYAMVENIDENVGRILHMLKENDLYENTVVVFMSDNGPIPERYNAGLRATKSTVYEGGIKSPFFIHYPGIFESGKKIPTTVAHIDLLPTILDICGMESDIPGGIDGTSMLPILRGETGFFDTRPLYWQWARGYPELYANVAIRKGDYKLVGHAEHNAGIGEFELYNISRDPFEEKNILEEEKEKALELKQNLDTWYQQTIREAGNPKPQGTVIDPELEDPVVLSRNDAKGYPEQWTREKIYSFWDVEFAREGLYDVTFTFIQQPEREGRVVIKMAPLQYSKMNTDTSVKEITLHNCYFRKGRSNLEAYYRIGFGEIISPLSLTITKSDS
jgi:arylsulfatase